MLQDLTISLGHYSLFIALLASVWSVVASLLGATIRGRGLQRSAERALVASAVLIGVTTVCLVSGFLTDDFRLDYVYHYSSTEQPLSYKIGALWGGQAGSLLLWVLILGVMGIVMVRTNLNKNRALMPVATAVVGGTVTFFLMLLNFVEPVFATGAMRPDGVGLNPQLMNYWMMIHPPSLYLGYVGFTIPFAFAMAALVTKRTGDIWFRTTRRWTLFSWFFLGIGVLLGSYWAYIELGWGGYWAWDPVENASLMPWLVATAFLHSVMIQEKKGMLKIWNVLLIILTFTLSIFGTFLTRSGIISSVHAFATSDIVLPFGIFLLLMFAGSLFVLILRLDSLKSEARFESVISREASFLFNNMILVGIALTVLFLTTFPMLSELVTGSKVTMGPPIFNMVNIPWGIALLFLTGVGPLIAWRRASRQNLRRNFILPSLAFLWVALAFIFFNAGAYATALGELFASAKRFDVVSVFNGFKAFYPALTFAVGAFVLGTVILEFWRGTRVRVHNYKESPPVAMGRLIWRNKRRYGGYIVHVGIVVIFFGIAGSSAYQLEHTQELHPGEHLVVENYLMRYDGYELRAVDNFIGSETHVSIYDRASGKPLGQIVTEQRAHPRMEIPQLRDAFLRAKRLGAEGSPAYQEAVASLFPLINHLQTQVRREVTTPSTEVGIHSFLSPLAGPRWGEDFYVIPMFVDSMTGRANFRIFVNPMVNLLWLGGLIFIVGAHLSVLPDSRERKRLQAAMEVEDRAVA